MLTASRLVCVLALTALSLAPPLDRGSQAGTAELDRLLGASAAYVARYEQESSAIVSEEHYVQTVAYRSAFNTTMTDKHKRELRSDVAVLNAGGGWLGYRDVYEVDGKPVRDRDDRLAALFITPTAGTLNRSRAIADESARFNIGNIYRNLNVPTMALAYLEKDRQSRSRFGRQGVEESGGVRAAVVTFFERARPTLIRSGTSDVTATSGRFWVEPDTGRVVRSELRVEVDQTIATIGVVYAPQPNVALWLPVSMTERYRTRTTEAIDGNATYSKFRMFKVDVTLIVK